MGALARLDYPLMRAILATGLVSMPRDALLQIVERFVAAKCGHTTGKEYAGLLEGLRPPAVLFNREVRDLLAGGVEASIRTLL